MFINVYNEQSFSKTICLQIHNDVLSCVSFSIIHHVICDRIMFFSIHLIMFCHQFWSMICTLISFIFMSSRLPSESCSLSLHHVCLFSSIDKWYGMILWIYVMPNISFAINSVILHINLFTWTESKKTYTSCSICWMRLTVAWYQTQSASFFIASPFALRVIRQTRPGKEAEKALKQYLADHPELQEVAEGSSTEKRKRWGNREGGGYVGGKRMLCHRKIIRSTRWHRSWRYFVQDWVVSGKF